MSIRRALLASLLGFASLSAATLAQTADKIVIHAHAPGHPFPHFWEQTFGSGRAILSLREGYRNDLREVKKVTEFRYVRFHNILHDEVGVYDEDDKGNPVYNFSYVYVEKAVKLRGAVKSALIYPVSVISMAVLIVAALLKWVVPIFANLFAGLGVALPLPTRIVVGLSGFVGQFWWFFIVGVGAAFFGVKQIRKNPKGRYYLDYGLLKMPIIGTLLRKIAVARFTRTLGTLITSGVPILEGLSITARTSGNAVLEEALMKVRKAIEEGRTIVDPLRESGVFPNMVTQMIGVGEATGAMDAMLQKVADFYEDEVDAATKDMLALLEPVLICFLGCAVGGIVISLYMPLFSLIAKMAG